LVPLFGTSFNLGGISMFSAINKVSLVLVTLALPIVSFAGPLSHSNSYLPLATCNDQQITFYQTYTNGSSTGPATGIISVSAKLTLGKVAQVSSINLIEGAMNTGMTFTTDEFGVITVSAAGRGDFNYQQCVQTPSGVTCQPQPLDLNCTFLPIPPSGLSAGN
jgi:hypothetical protein